MAAGPAAALALTGGLLWIAWTRGGLPLEPARAGLTGHPPDPYAWPRLLALGVPATFALFSLLHAALGRRAAAAARYARLDARSYGLLPAMVALVLLAPRLATWPLVLGAAYLGLVGLKTGLAVRAVWVGFGRAAPPAPAPGGPLGSWLFLVGLAASGLASGYLTTVLSTTGDEPYYLLVAHSLLRDRDLDLANNFANRDYAPFYWGVLFDGQNTVRTATGGLYSVTYSGLLAWLLLPGYALAGRYGAVLIQNALAAALMTQLFLLAWEVTGSRRAAFLTWLALAFTAPVWFFAAQLYPEVPAALAVAWAIRRIRRLPAAGGRPWLALLPALAALPLLKLRYVLVALPLLGWALVRARRGRPVAGALGAAGLAGLALLLLDRALLGGLLYAEYLARIPVGDLLRPRGLMVITGAGILLDQEFGLLPYAPVYALAAFGLGGAWRRDRGTLGLLLTVACYVYPFLHSSEWYGGFSVAARYFVCLVPVAAVLVACALADGRSAAFAAGALAAWLWSLGLAVWLTLVPGLRYNSGTGEAGWLVQLGRALGPDVSRLFPSSVNPSIQTPWLWLGGALALAGLFLAGRRAGGGAQAQDGPAGSPRTVVLAVTALGAAGLALGGLARALPTVEVEGEHMTPAGRGVLFPGSGDLPFKAWVMRSPGSLARTIRLPGGARRLVVLAGGYSTDGEAPRLRVSLDGRVVGETDVVAGAGTWRTAAYPFTLPATPGRRRLTLELLNGVDDRAGGKARHLLVDKVRIEAAE